MKPMLAILMTLTILVCCAGPAFAGFAFPATPAPKNVSETTVRSDDSLIRAALSSLRSAWQKEYSNSKWYPAGEYVVDIRGTRLIRIKDELAEREAKYFGDISCLIEFLMYDDSYGMDGPGHNAGYHDISMQNYTVVVYRSGLMSSVKMSPIQTYRSRTYISNFSTFIEEVVDYRDQYNQVFTFTVK